MTNFRELLRVLGQNQVEFVIVGGLAATVHGSSRFTKDLDIVYRRTPDNVTRLVNALANYEPYLRGAPPGLPFNWDERTIRSGLNFTLITSLGAVDLLGEIIGGGSSMMTCCHIRCGCNFLTSSASVWAWSVSSTSSARLAAPKTSRRLRSWKQF